MRFLIIGEKREKIPLNKIFPIKIVLNFFPINNKNHISFASVNSEKVRKRERSLTRRSTGSNTFPLQYHEPQPIDFRLQSIAVVDLAKDPARRNLGVNSSFSRFSMCGGGTSYTCPLKPRVSSLSRFSICQGDLVHPPVETSGLVSLVSLCAGTFVRNSSKKLCLEWPQFVSCSSSSSNKKLCTWEMVKT